MKTVSLTALGRTLALAGAIAIGAAAFFGTVFAQKNLTGKPTAAIYIEGDSEDREVVKLAVFNALVKGNKYNMVAIDAIDLLIKEHIRQEDKASTVKIAEYGRNAGAEWVCVVKFAELKGKTYMTTRMIDVATKTAPYSEMKEMPDGAEIMEFINKQIYLMLAGTPKGTR
jgi:DNA-dependent RNA polymerase auxiliary subunit epsilon